MYALCVSGAVNTQGFVWKFFLCAIYKFSFIHSIAQKCLNKKGQKLYVAFVDFKKAFNSVHHDKLLQAMQKEGVQGKLFASIKAMHDSLLFCVMENGEYSDFFFIVPLVSARGVY